MHSKLLVIATVFLASLASPALAITAKDVTEKMSKEERFSYLTGLVDMLSYQSILAGNKARAKCIVDKFYDDKKVLGRVYAALEKYPAKAPEGLVILVMNEACSG